MIKNKCNQENNKKKIKIIRIKVDIKDKFERERLENNYLK